MITVCDALEAEARSLCARVLGEPPKFFGREDANVIYADAAAKGPTLIAEDRAPVGFLTLRQTSDGAADIHVMAVAKDARRRGIGGALVTAAVKTAQRSGASFLTVKTLGPSRADENYAGTRAFYAAKGFSPLQEFTDFWGAGVSMLLMSRAL